MVGNKRKKDENAEQNADAKETQPTLYGFRGVYVFDITQTEGKELPTLTEVQGDVSGYRERLVKFVEVQGVDTQLLRKDRTRQGPVLWREDHAAFRDAARRGIFHANA